MRYHIIHRTTYVYDGPVTIGHYLARLEPRDLPWQDCPWHELTVSPEPMEFAGQSDYFGNACAYFEIAGAHEKLEILSRSYVDVRAAPVFDPSTTPPWETIREACCADRYDPATAAGEMRFGSPLIQPSKSFGDYAIPSFPPGRPILEGLVDLTSRVYTDFSFDPTATDSATPIDVAFEKKRGVCQDFAQVMIACLRSIGLPARYVSGYLETIPPPGKPRMVGADASHAWVSLYCGENLGWMDADPTNNCLPSERHITLAWGRDFQDVSPLTGIALGDGSQSLRVEVDVIPMVDV